MVNENPNFNPSQTLRILYKETCFNKTCLEEAIYTVAWFAPLGFKKRVAMTPYLEYKGLDYDSGVRCFTEVKTTAKILIILAFFKPEYIKIWIHRWRNMFFVWSYIYSLLRTLAPLLLRVQNKVWEVKTAIMGVWDKPWVGKTRYVSKVLRYSCLVAFAKMAVLFV